RTVGNPGRGEHHVARGEIEQFVFAIEVGNSDAMGAGALVVVAEQQPALHLPADAAQRRRRQYAFRRPARADIHVDPGLRFGGGNDAADITVRDQSDPGPGLAYLGDQLGVARAVEDADDKVRNLDLLRLGQVLQVRRRRLVEVD